MYKTELSEGFCYYGFNYALFMDIKFFLLAILITPIVVDQKVFSTMLWTNLTHTMTMLYKTSPKMIRT